MPVKEPIEAIDEPSAAQEDSDVSVEGHHREPLRGSRQTARCRQNDIPLMVG